MSLKFQTPHFSNCPFCGGNHITLFTHRRALGDQTLRCDECGASAPAMQWEQRANERGVREAVYNVIDAERDYQREKWGEEKHEVASFVTYMQHHLTRAIAEVSTQHTVEAALDQIRKVTALGVACMEQNGWVER